MVILFAFSPTHYQELTREKIVLTNSNLFVCLPEFKLLVFRVLSQSLPYPLEA